MLTAKDICKGFGDLSVLKGISMTVEKGEVYVAESDCPGGDCMHQGKISRKGQRIACAPNGVIITVSGGKDGEVDVIAG